jgi:hypothetical protein
MSTWGKLKKAAAQVDPSRIAPRGTGTTIGRVIGATTGGIAGGPVGAAVGQNIGRMIGGGMPGITAMMKGNIMGKTKGPNAVPQGADGRPVLADWSKMNQEEIRGTDLFRPTLLDERAMSTGLAAVSPWEAMARQKQQAEQDMQLNQAMGQAQGALAGSRASLAMRGGLRGGAAERLAMAGNESLLNTAQGVRGAGAIERGKIGLQGAEMARQIAGQNVAAQTAGQGANIQAALNELMAKRAYDLGKYQEEMKGFAAGKTAEALGKEQKPGLISDPLGYLQSKIQGK